MAAKVKLSPEKNSFQNNKNRIEGEVKSSEESAQTRIKQQSKNTKIDKMELIQIGKISQAQLESGRSKPLAAELKQVAATVDASPSTIPTDDVASSVDIFISNIVTGEDEYDELADFMPYTGCWLGAPACRWASSVMALSGMMVGLVLATSGACILIFFVDEEPTVWPLGVTLGTVGILLALIGALMWISEFLCGDCLGRAHQKIKEAPLKQALKRRSRMTSRASEAPIIDSQVGSRLSNSTNASDISRNVKI